MIEKRKLSKYQIKSAFEYFNDLYSKPGQKPSYSAFIFENRERLAPIYMQMMNEVYDENRDPQYMEYRQRLAEIQARLADKNEDGSPVLDQNQQFVITQNRDQLMAEGTKLNEEFKDLVDRMQNKNKTNNEVFSQIIEVDVAILTASEFINEAPPYIVGLFKHSGV